MTAKAKIVPYGDRVLVRRDAAAKSTAGGILLPEVVVAGPDRRNLPKFGTVLAVGRGRRMEDGTVRPIDLKVGDRVVVSVHCGVEVPDPDAEGEVLIIAESDEIMGRVS